jgi:hypothetical protein
MRTIKEFIDENCENCKGKMACNHYKSDKAENCSFGFLTKAKNIEYGDDDARERKLSIEDRIYMGW